MGIESDQLVFDYLSRVGDLAQQRQLPSKARMGLVASLRDEIDRQREDGEGADSPAAVRRILARLGSPDAIVAAVEGGGLSVPGQRTGRGPESGGPGSRGPEPRGSKRWGSKPWGSESRNAGSQGPESQGPDGGPGFRSSEPRSSEPRSSESWSSDEGPEPDWWSVVPGFTGGVEVPELLEPPKPAEDPAEDPVEKAAEPPRRRGPRRLLGRAGAARPAAETTRTGSGAAPGAAEAAGTASGPAEAAGTAVGPASGAGRGRVRRLLLRGRKAAPAPVAPAPTPSATRARRFGDPVLLLAAGCLVLGTVTGSWIALAAGWLLAYATRRLSRAQAKWGVLGLPGAVAAGAVVWLWGRLDGRWGEPIPPGGPALTQALQETWPWTLRTAALATAAYLFWRARRS
ncbi:hypothetical protein RND61_08265 [Streptomyces sp. TRM76323]|uniref:Integral membrane protein n=1 Tax=Streptomyces tamarix TaxID=3078565 RepID=A0ABU3QH19_9ACTN|nr:hypothetical protein [Streptomyces tamarix]MDT9682067.1 hypothetical protein [Streptomyces tamarix]